MALATNALTNVTTLESILGLVSGAQDAALQRVINQASAIAETYTGRVFYRNTAIAEKHPGVFGPILAVRQPPLNSITSIAYLGTAESTSSYEIHDANQGAIYRIYGNWEGVDPVFRDASQTVYTGAGRKVWTVTYDGGWYTPKQDDDDVAVTRNLPHDIEQAAIAIAVFLRKSEARDPTLRSESLLSASQAFAGVSGADGKWLEEAVPGAAMILQRYRLGFFG